jgi:hypothetical protein
MYQNVKPAVEIHGCVDMIFWSVGTKGSMGMRASEENSVRVPGNGLEVKPAVEIHGGVDILKRRRKALDGSEGLGRERPYIPGNGLEVKPAVEIHGVSIFWSVGPKFSTAVRVRGERGHSMAVGESGTAEEGQAAVRLLIPGLGWSCAGVIGTR